MALRSILAVAVPAILAACGAGQPPAAHGGAADPDPAAIHERVITLDTHVDIPLNYATDEVDPGVRGPWQVDLPKMREGGLDVAFFIVFVPQLERTHENYRRVLDMARTKFDAIRRMTYELYPGEIELAYTAADVERIARSGKRVAAIGIENGFAVGPDLSLLEEYHRLGARYGGLVHNGHNDIADSAQPRPNLGDEPVEHGGLSAFGRRYVRELNRLGILVDVSHASKDAMLQAAELSRAPIIASHSSVRALADHPRNLDDEQLLALRDNGGVVQIVALGAFVKEQPPERMAAVRELRARFELRTPNDFLELSDEDRAEYDAGSAEINERWPPATLQDFVDHIDYAVDLIGIDHVAISSDFDGGGGVVGWNDASETANVTAELVRRGYSEEEIAKIWSGNTLRIWREAERVSLEMRTEGVASAGR